MFLDRFYIVVLTHTHKPSHSIDSDTGHHAFFITLVGSNLDDADLSAASLAMVSRRGDAAVNPELHGRGVLSGRNLFDLISA